MTSRGECPFIRQYQRSFRGGNGVPNHFLAVGTLFPHSHGLAPFAVCTTLDMPLCNKKLTLIFTARRYASAVYAVVVRLFVWVSVSIRQWVYLSYADVVLQVYLLTPMDHATLPHAKSTISHCTPSVITRQQVLWAIFLNHITKQTYSCRLLTHTCMVRLNLHLVDLLSTYYTTSLQQMQ